VNKAILHKEVQNFINTNLNTDIAKLIFKGSPFGDVSIQEIATQIESKKRAQNKLPTWFNTPFIYYPNKLNIEQTSSEVTANYKADLVSGDSLIDLTGGFGVDSYYFSKQFKKVIHCEINPALCELTAHNFKELKALNIETIQTNGISYLQTQQSLYDWIFIDPSRRNDVKGKVFLLEDCLPNIPKNLEILFKFSNNILLKASPMLDITKAIGELKFVKEVHVIAIDNEVKELLFVLDKNYAGKIIIKAVNHKKGMIELFESELGKSSTSDYSLPRSYLFEPNSAILKAGLFSQVTHQLNLYKIHINSHLYTSDNLIDFPGRCFRILQTLPFNLKELKKILPGSKANITVRNFPETVAKIRKKSKIKDGGDHYLFFTTDCHNKHVILVCKKV